MLYNKLYYQLSQSYSRYIQTGLQYILYHKEAYVKRTISLVTACLVLVGLFGVSCKKLSMKDLEYMNVSAKDCYQAYVKKKGGDIVLWFQVYDNSGDNKNDKAILNSYKNVADKVENYPAKIYKDKWIWLLVNNRMEIRLIADDKSRDFQNTDELKKFIKSFDLDAMAKVTGPKMKAKDLEKFIPKIGQ
jgi:hypothetical protein